MSGNGPPAGVTNPDAPGARGGAFDDELLDAVPAPILIVDERRRIQGVNSAAERLFGWSEDELLDHDVAVLMRRGEARRRTAVPREALDGVAETASGSRTWRLRPVRGRHRDGSSFPIEVAVSEMPSSPGEPRRFIAAVQDLSERAHAEAQLLQAQRTEALARLVAGVAHDFNNLLSVIAGAIELARGRDPEADHWLDRADAAATRATAIIRQLLQYARREPSAQAPVDLAALAEATVGLLRDTMHRRITIEVRAQPGLPPVLADSSQLEQVLMNLLVNASDAIADRLGQAGADPIENGRVSVSLEQRRGDDGLPLVVVGVRDNGPGMHDDVASRVFDPFFTTKPEGTGLGLSTSFGIVQGHGGEITVYSEPGVGTLFEVSLPAVTDVEGAATTRLEGGENIVNLPLPRTVLVVDDEADVLAITQRMLEAAGCVVATAADGFAAVDAARSREFDVVLLDVNMPGPSGWTVLDWLLAGRADQVVLMMSGFASEAEARVRGAAGLLLKPFDSTALLRALTRAAAATGRPSNDRP